MNTRKAILILALMALLISMAPLMPVVADSNIELSSFTTSFIVSPRIVALVCILVYVVVAWFSLRRLRIFGAPGPPVFLVWLSILARVCRINEVAEKIMLRADNIYNLKNFSQRAAMNS